MALKNTKIITTYFANSHFVGLQSKSFKKYIEDDYDFTVFDDSDSDTKSILTNKLSSIETEEECRKYGVEYIKIPQSIHAFEKDGGYTPNINETFNHPTERQQACLRWLFRNYKQHGFDQYKTLVLLDADVLIKHPINISKFMEYDIIGTGRNQLIDLPLDKFPAHMFPENVRGVNKTTIYFFTMYIMFFNMQKINNLHTLDIGSWPYTDTGSKTNFFIKDNPQYTHSFLNERHNPDYRLDFISKSNVFDEHTAEFIHYRASSNWLHETSGYYQEKLNRMLKIYMRDFYTGPSENQEFKSRDGEHILKK